MVRGRHAEKIGRVVYTILCAIWLLMFFRPMSELGLISGASSFIVPLAILVVSLWFPWLFVRFIGAVVASFGYITLYWRQPDVPFASGLQQAFEHLWQAVMQLLENHQLVDPLQTFLFLWLMIGVLWLVLYASHRTKLWVFYNVLAIAVFAAIDGNTDVHPNLSIVVVSIIGVIILGLNQLIRIQLFLPFYERAALHYVTPLMVLVAAAALLAAALPKQPPVWANPFGASSSGGQGTAQTIGYQLNDSRLGGSFVANDDPVMDVYSSEPVYLRGQTLSDYTGKGWKSADLTGAQTTKEHLGKSFTDTGNASFKNLPSQIITQRIDIRSSNLNTHDLFGGYAINEVVHLPRLANSGVLTLDTLQGNLIAPELKLGDSYVIKVRVLRNPYQVLGKDTTAYTNVEGDIPSEIRKADLELPSALPDRVRKLAQRVVQSNRARTEYQMVTALINYLQVNYNYQTYDIPVPKGRQDYVDQFLFDTKCGYCNNFSSSLAVMLRTLGVPTRWVTGFASTADSEDYSYPGPQHRYIVTNNDAHSWVEVYFPQYGWVPFDPTPSFTMPFAASANVNLPTSTPPSSTPPTKTPPQAPTKVPQLPQTSSSGNSVSLIAWGSILRAVLYVVLGLLVAAALLWWLFRSRFTLYRLERKWKRKPDIALSRSYMLVFRAIRKRFGLEKSVTLRELWPYAASVGIGQSEYCTWVQTAERLLYNGQSFDKDTAFTMQRTSMRWLRLLYQSEKRQKSSFDDK